MKKLLPIEQFIRLVAADYLPYPRKQGDTIDDYVSFAKDLIDRYNAHYLEIDSDNIDKGIRRE